MGGIPLCFSLEAVSLSEGVPFRVSAGNPAVSCGEPKRLTASFRAVRKRLTRECASRQRSPDLKISKLKPLTNPCLQGNVEYSRKIPDDLT